MFERYTEPSRRAIYFARTEALARNSPAIETKDLLLGLAHDPSPEGHPFAMLHTRRDELRTLVGASPVEKMPEAKDLPLSRTCKIALAYATKEANRDKQFSLEPYHLLIGIVLTKDSTAAALNTIGWNPKALRYLSKETQKLFPNKRPPRSAVAKRHRRNLIIATTVFLTLVALITYLRLHQSLATNH